MKKIILILILSLPFLFIQLNAQTKPTENISQYKLPLKMELCGEKIPLDDPEIRERAEREFYLLLQQPGQIILYIKRAGKYFPMYEKIIKENNLPEDLKYLSVAESALFQARSAKDAVGLWQLMEGTARTLGLRVDNFVDERRHPLKSTIAAIKYLKQGFASHKSWISTLAGYNMGHTGVKNSLDYQDSDNYFELYLNEETSRFIFRILAIKEIMSNPDKYGFKISKSEIYQPEKTKIVKVNSAIDNISEWAQKNNSTYKDIKILNPWILGRSLPAPKSEPYEIMIFE